MAITCSDVLPFSSTVQTTGCAPRATGGGLGYHFRWVGGGTAVSCDCGGLRLTVDTESSNRKSKGKGREEAKIRVNPGDILVCSLYPRSHRELLYIHVPRSTSC